MKLGSKSDQNYREFAQNGLIGTWRLALHGVTVHPENADRFKTFTIQSKIMWRSCRRCPPWNLGRNQTKTIEKLLKMASLGPEDWFFMESRSILIMWIVLRRSQYKIKLYEGHAGGVRHETWVEIGPKLERSCSKWPHWDLKTGFSWSHGPSWLGGSL